MVQQQFTMTGDLPRHLAGREPAGWMDGEPVAQFGLGPHRNFIYLILDLKTRKAAIVDPREEVDEILSLLAAKGYSLSRIILTHTHFDHVGGVASLIQRHPALPINVHEEDLHRLSKEVLAHPALERTDDGDLLSVGSMLIHAMHTPGHSAGALSYYFYGPVRTANETARLYLLTGDTLFIRDCGRTDLETGSPRQMYESLQRFKELPPQTIILPGHHYAPEVASVLEHELRTSPPLLCKSAAELEALP